MVPDNDKFLFLQITFFSILWKADQRAIDLLRFDSRWGEPNQRSLLSFEWRTHQMGWTFDFDIAYLQFEYDTLTGWDWFPWWYREEEF